MLQKHSSFLLTLLVMAVLALSVITAASAPSSDYYRLVVISDLHYSYKYLETPDPQKGRKIVVAKEKALREVNSWDDVQEVVLTGDLVAECGSASEYDGVKRFLTGLHQPLSCLVGNHEYLYRDDPHGRLRRGDRATQSLKLDSFRATFGRQKLYFSKRVGSYLLVYLAVDQLQPSFTTEISQPQMEWLRALLAANRKTPTIIFFHAPLANTLLQYNDKVNQANAIAQPERQLDTLLRTNPQVFLWVSGHTHTGADNRSYNDKVNYFEGRVLDIHNGTWDRETICTNSLYLYRDHVVIRTYNHKIHQWLNELERNITMPQL